MALSSPSFTSKDPLLPFFISLSEIQGIGKAKIKLFKKLTDGTFVRDLLFYLPTDFIERPRLNSLSEAVMDKTGTFTLTVREKIFPPSLPLKRSYQIGKKSPFRLIVADKNGQEAEIILFNPRPAEKILPGSQIILSGKAGMFRDKLTFTHPDFLLPADKAFSIPLTEPVWPLTAGLWSSDLRRAFRQVFSLLPQTLPEWQSAGFLQRSAFPDFMTALREIQVPQKIPSDQARRRLAFDELLAGQLAFALIRRRKKPGRAFLPTDKLTREALSRFGYPLTSSQEKVRAEIRADMASSQRMIRLLQGDVGAGKTVMALLAALQAVEAGAQAALMVPTEVLAFQHAKTFSRLSPVPVGCLTGSLKPKEKRLILSGLADGSLPLVVGTHALFQKDAIFKDLGLAIIDEQHRFGVNQRLGLSLKGTKSDVLVMTATPIPRTLLITGSGDLSVSKLEGKPHGRLEIKTSLHRAENEPEILAGLKRAVMSGQQIFWVCPLVLATAEHDLAAAEARFNVLQEIFGDQVGLAHGKQPPAVRDQALADFAAGKTRILVATTIIEVGVDIPKANIIIIEEAERFGLAQLHQLRGRVGRGETQSYCLLLHKNFISKTAFERLSLLKNCHDGFAIADADFTLRGGGEFLGTKQSGLPAFKAFDPQKDEDLPELARHEAHLLLEEDPHLSSPRGQAARLLLRLFDQVKAVRILHAG